ncbi:MAG: glycosyltransferase, partial [Lachnospiraceae bacterium]|nr:glycosyltransferase [Lachnospiraceae bacterium]
MVRQGSGKHVAMYIGSLCMGGAEHVMVNLAEALFARGWRVTLVTTYLAEEEYEVPHGLWRRIVAGEAAEEGAAVLPDPEEGKSIVYALTPSEKRVPVEQVSWRLSGEGETGMEAGGQGNGIARVFSGIASGETGGRLSAFRHRVKRLEKIWKDIKPDVILSFIGKNNFMALLTAGRFRIPVVVSVRATPVVEYPTAGMRLTARFLFPKAAAVAVQSRAAGEWFSGAVSRKAVVVPNAVSAEFLSRRAGGQNAAERGDRSERIIAAVGRLDENKNYRLLLEAVAGLLREDRGTLPPIRVILYGEGSERQNLEKEAAALGIADRVTFMGQVQGVADRLSRADIYCLTSDREGMPNTLIEAMCLELPCITTDCVYGGMEQFVT